MKKIFLVLLAGSAFQLNSSAQFFKKDAGLAHTFSIVARDAVTGEMAVGVQSHWFSVGTAVSWGEAGVGVVATQSFVNKSYGLKGLELMNKGKTAPDALKELLAADEGREVRQVAMIDANGNVNAYTGKNCIDHAGNIVGKNYSVQSNMMLTDKVNAAMAKAFEESEGKPLAERVLISIASCTGCWRRYTRQTICRYFSCCRQKLPANPGTND